MEVQTAARALEAAGRSVVHMEIGEPDFPTPQPVLDAARDAIAKGDIYYTSALGIPALREAIARHYREQFHVEVEPSEQHSPEALSVAEPAEVVSAGVEEESLPLEERT